MRNCVSNSIFTSLSQITAAFELVSFVLLAPKLDLSQQNNLGKFCLILLPQLCWVGFVLIHALHPHSSLAPVEALYSHGITFQRFFQRFYSPFRITGQ